MSNQKSCAVGIRVMTEPDVIAGVRLNTIAGWNQTAADWHRFIENSPDGCFVAEIAGQVVGTAATICYENRFAWIGMVLVDPESRNLGIGTQLLRKTIEYLDRIRISTIKLDATPLGKPIYLKLGFVPEYEIERWVLKRQPGAASPEWDKSRAISANAALADICRCDREFFGADRGFILRSLHEAAPELTNAIWKDGVLKGYAYARKGLFADHFGPCVANDDETSAQLLRSFLQRSHRENVITDCLSLNAGFLESLRMAGFVFSRPLTRMVRGPNLHPGKPESVCAILGPEFG